MAAALVGLTLVLGAGRAAAAPHAVVTLGFDDGYASHATVGPMLTARGMHGTFYVISGYVGQSGFLTWPQVTALAAAGHEIGGHTLDHTDLTTVDETEARRQICDDRTALQSHGLQVTDFAYPFGAFDGQAEQAAEACGYDSARTTGWFGPTCPGTCTESIPPQDPFATTVVGFSDQSLPELQTVVTHAEAAGGWAQIVIHDVCDSGCAISPATMGTFLDWLATRVTAGALTVETVHQVMTTPPDTSITDGVAGTTTEASPSFSFVSGAVTGVTFSCRLDGPGTQAGTWSPCTSSENYDGLADGSYTFAVRASTAPAGPDPTPASRSFTVDTAAPAPPAISAPEDASWNASGTIGLSGTAEAGSTVELFDGEDSQGTALVDGSGTWSMTLSGVPDGAHTYTATASDAAGNASDASAPRTVQVDTAAPAPPQISSPAEASWIASGTVVVHGTAEAGSTIELLDGASAAATASANGLGAWTATVSGVPDGDHAYTAVASDAAGNTSSASGARIVRVDTVAPDTSLGTAPSGTIVATSAALAFAGSADAVAFECALDGAPFTPCSSPMTVLTLAPGPHTFAVRARDLAGNADPTPATQSWTVALPVPPALTPSPAAAAPVMPVAVPPPAAAAVAPRLGAPQVRRVGARGLRVRFTTDQAGTVTARLVRCARGAPACRRSTLVARATRPVGAGQVSVDLRTPRLAAGTYRVRIVVRGAGGRESGVLQQAITVRRTR